MEKNIFTFNKNRCVGCQACVVACVNENDHQPAGHWKKVHSSNPSHLPFLALFYLSLSCNHCDEAPCMQSCPTRAYYRDKITGAVLHHPEKCIGCRICTWACPYDSPVYNPREGIIGKCTFCQSRLEKGLKPACANQCPLGALDFTRQEFDAAQALASSPVPVKVGSSLKVEELENSLGPKTDSALFRENPIPEEASAGSNSRITALKEWPLLVFSLLTASLVGLFAHGTYGIPDPVWNYLILAAGGLSAAISLLHLGRKTRAWRSLANVRFSWLSREILFFLLFYLSLLFHTLVFPLPKVLTLGLGLLLLISMDRLYTLAYWNWKIKVHSSQTLLLALSLFLLLQGFLTLFIALSAVRILLYLIRKPGSGGMSRGQILSMCLRLLALTAALTLALYAGPAWITVLCFFLGEVMDRIEFYNELNVPVPLPAPAENPNVSN